MSAARESRDLRIDFFRGAALYMIIIDHIAYNPLAAWTYQRFGFSDGAEVFVFLSGVSCGLAYPKMLARIGWPALVTNLLRRAARIYLHYVLASLAAIALIWSMRGPLNAAGVAIARDWLIIESDPYSSIFSSMLLLQQPSLPGILVLYMVLTLGALPLMLAGARSSSALTVMVSGAIWLIPQYGLMSLDQPSRLFPYFNPLAWQFLFCIGVIFGRYRIAASSGTIDLRRPSPCLLTVAWSVVIVSMFWRFYPSVATRLDWPLDWYFPIEFLGAGKYNLSAARLIHFLSVVFLIGTYVKPAAAFLRCGHDCFIDAGKHSLSVFSLGTVLSLLGTLIFQVFALSILDKIAFNVLAILCTAVLVGWLTYLPKPADGAVKPDH